MVISEIQRFPARIRRARNNSIASAVLGLVADVGGTHIRFGIAVGGAGSAPAQCPLRAPLSPFARMNPSRMPRSITAAPRPACPPR